MAHLLPQLRCQFAEFLNDCQLKRLRILYQLTCGSFQVRFYMFKEAQYYLSSLFTSIFIYIFRLYAFLEHFTQFFMSSHIISSSFYPLGLIQRPINFPISLRREGLLGASSFSLLVSAFSLGIFMEKRQLAIKLQCSYIETYLLPVQYRLFINLYSSLVQLLVVSNQVQKVMTV